MRLRCHFYSISGALGVFVLLILSGYGNLNTISYVPYPETVNRSQIYVETILNMKRLKTKLDMWDYNFTYSGVNTLEDLLMESGGTPMRSLIVSTWRSGSTFLGDLLNAMPSNFYHYEPLLTYKNNQVRKQSDAKKASHLLKNLLNCNYNGTESYFKLGKIPLKYGYYGYNTRLWENCKHKKELCVDANFIASFCKVFPFQTMKLVRFRLRFIENILDDKKLNVKVLLLVRDPRGVMQSRSKVTFCLNKDCSDPELLCSDMVSDYVAANQLFQKYPDRLMVLRFEDLALNLNETTFQLLKFLRLEPNQSIEEFLSTHTNGEKGGDYSTFRVSRDVVFKWRTLLDFNYVSKIQKVCKEAMGLWGYQLANSSFHMTSKDFYPLKSYSMNMSAKQ